MKAKVRFVGISTMTVTVDIPSDEVPSDADDVQDYIVEVAREMIPDLCAQCAGWGQEHSLESPGEWVLSGELRYTWDGSAEDDAVEIVTQ